MQRTAQAMGAGNSRKAKKALAKAARALKKLEGRLRTKKAQKAVPPGVAAMLQAAAEQVRADVLTLRGTL
jgi:hypothetical protein